MHNEMPGLVVPDHVLERYRVAGPAARDVGLALGHELIEGARAVAQGVYVMAPFEQPMNVVELLPALSRAQSPVDTGALRRARARGRRATSVRRSRSARRARGEDRRCDRTCCVDRRAAGVAVSHAAGDGGDRARHGPVPVRVAGEDDRGAADAAGRRRERAVLRDSRGSRRAFPASDQRTAAAAPSAPRTRSTATSLCASNADARRRGTCRGAGNLHCRVVLARDNMRRRDDETRASQTSRCLRLRYHKPCRRS